MEPKLKVIVWEDKHSTVLYRASTPDELDASAIKILDTLTDEAYGYWYVDTSEPYTTEEDRELLALDPETVPEPFKDKVRNAHRRYQEAINYRTDSSKRYIKAREYVEAGESPRSPKGTPLSWLLIQSYSDGEYERIYLENVE